MHHHSRAGFGLIKLWENQTATIIGRWGRIPEMPKHYSSPEFGRRRRPSLIHSRSRDPPRIWNISPEVNIKKGRHISAFKQVCHKHIQGKKHGISIQSRHEHLKTVPDLSIEHQYIWFFWQLPCSKCLPQSMRSYSDRVWSFICSSTPMHACLT